MNTAPFASPAEELAEGIIETALTGATLVAAGHVKVTFLHDGYATALVYDIDGRTLHCVERHETYYDCTCDADEDAVTCAHIVALRNLIGEGHIGPWAVTVPPRLREVVSAGAAA